MSTFYDTIIEVISKPSKERQHDEILAILAWFLNLFKRKSAVFGDIKPEVVKDIIKNCSFETKNPDDIIIKQGDVGDCFYINLRGKVSIYINHKKLDETEKIDDEPYDDASGFNEKSLDSFESSFTSSMWSSSSTKSKRLREKLGNYVTSLGPGEGFGEVALVRDEPRTASIIADEKTDLMVVNKTLYSRCLHESAMRKLNEKQEFINNSAFFGNWQPKMKKLLSLCLERDIIPYDSYLGKQGEPADRMFFIVSGQAKLIVNPSAHKNQFSRFYPLKLPENENQEFVSSLLEERQQLKTSPRRTNSGSIANIVIKRRSETFAEAEQRRKNQQTELGILGAGEISGMCEIIFDMPTYMQSTRCLESCDVFYIYKRSYERLIAKRNPSCIVKMKAHVLAKLAARNARLPIEFFRSIEYTIRQQFKPPPPPQPASSSSSSTTSAITSSSSSLQSPRVFLPQHSTSASFPNAAALFSTSIRRGAYVQLDTHTYMRPKSTKLLKSRTLRDASNAQKQEKMRLAVNMILSKRASQADDANKKDEKATAITTTVHPIIVEPNQNIVIINAVDSDLNKLDDLEDKMKKWQLDIGCKKAFVTKMKRIELPEASFSVEKRNLRLPINALYNNYKLNGNLRQSQLNGGANTSTSVSVASPSSSKNQRHIVSLSAQASHSKNESRQRAAIADTTKRHHTTAMAASDTRRLLRHRRRSSSSSNISISSINSFGEATLSSDDRSPTASDNRQQQQNYHVDDMLTFEAIRSRAAPIEINTSKLSCLPSQNNMHLLPPVPLPSADVASSNMLATSAQTILHSILSNMAAATATQCSSGNEREFAPDLPSSWTASLVDETQQPLSQQSDQYLLRQILKPSNAAPKDTKPNRKKSNCYYLVRRKFNMCQVKVQSNGGRQYTKEEYLALKDLLKRQIRRSSIPLAF